MRYILHASTVAISILATCVAAYAAPPQLKSEKFATTIFKLAAKKLESNVVVSPYSVSTALTMTYNGANAKTKSEMQQVLGYGGLSDTAVNEQNASLNKSLNQVNPVSELTIANALFARKNAVFKPSFITTNSKYFGAKLEALNFESPSALTRINDWVKENTKGKIPTILDKLQKDAILYLVNGIYFKGTWLNEFKKSETKTTDFILNSGGKKSVPMMNRTAKMLHLKGDSFEAVMLPYKDNRLQMCVFLPDKNSNIAALVAKFNEQNWQQWISKFSETEGNLALPRFKVEYKTELSAVLKEAGMPCAFNDSCADFKNMIDQDVFISRVLHKTYLEVNEKGTEAAAATAVEMMPRGAFMPSTPFKMVCDRPFIIAIFDKQTGAILFMGAIVDPIEAN